MTDYLAVNRANWDERAQPHASSPDYGVERLLGDPSAISDVVAFDRERLGDLTGLDVVHLQCHIGTDTLSLARLGANSVTGVDLSPKSLDEARRLAERAQTPIEYVESDVYAAPAALRRNSLGDKRFDLVYTGIGALCWLPSVERWAQVVAELLKPGGRLFIREGHPVLWAMGDNPATAKRTITGDVSASRNDSPSADNSSGADVRTTNRGDDETFASPALEFSYFEREEPLVFDDGDTYVETDHVFTATKSVEWNHGLGEIITALVTNGLRIDALVEHESVPWEALPGQMVCDAHGEWRLAERPERLPASYTLQATRTS